MTGAPYESWGPGQHGPGDTGASGWPPSGPPPGAPQRPGHTPQGYPYIPQQPYQPYGPPSRPVQGAQPYSSFAPQLRPTAPPSPPRGSQPLGPRKPDSLSIDSYKPPKRRVGSLVAFLVGFAVLIGAFIAIDRYARTAQDAPAATPSATATLPGLAFDSSSATGSWEITNTQWSSSQVVLTVRVMVATGTFHYSFYAYNNTSMRLAYPDTASSSTLRSGTLSAGQSASGTLSFQIARGDGTLVMIDDMENQVSGLPIKP